MTHHQNALIFAAAFGVPAIRDSFGKLDPRQLIKAR